MGIFFAYFFHTDCISYLKVNAMMAGTDGGSQSPYDDNPILTVVLHSGLKYQAKLNGYKSQNVPYTAEFHFPSAFGVQNCVTRDDIREVYLEPDVQSKDRLYIASINTYIRTDGYESSARVNKYQPYALLTSDPGFSMWVDSDDKYPYPYNAKKHVLTKAGIGNCISYVRVNAVMEYDHRANSLPQYRDNYLLVLRLINDDNLQAVLEGPVYPNEPYIAELQFPSRFQTNQCVKSADIKDVRLEVQSFGNDGWYIASADTFAKSGTEQYEHLADTNFTNLNRVDIPDCGHGKPACECSENATYCIFNLEIDEIRTFTSYQKLSVADSPGLFVRGTQGVNYYFDDNGVAQSLQKNRTCSKPDSTLCTEPQYVDGKTYRLAIAVNGQIPGPTIIVHEKQLVKIHVHNNLTSEGISIHWHGMHQIGTPWMDGVAQVTQCPIGPSSSFSYMYTASPSGTFWYHSHSGAQRTDGFYGALIVKERDEKRENITAILNDDYDIEEFEDFPDKHTITLIDWQHVSSLDLFSQLAGQVGFYPDNELGKVPTPGDNHYATTHSYDNGVIGPVPYYSGLINGKGRHNDVPYKKTRLSVFTVKKGNIYRFRLIGAQGLFAYKFSIDGHKLTVVGTDGYWIRPVKEVDYIIIHTGERYDFLLNAIELVHVNYWIRAETLEINKCGNPPYKSLEHVAEAILHYEESEPACSDTINSTAYESIKKKSPPKQCNCTNSCIAVNCPFKNFHSSYHIECVNVHDLQLLLPTPLEELPAAEPDSDPDCLQFLNFNFEGDSNTGSVNGRNLILPAFPPQIQPEQFYANDSSDVRCNLEDSCNPYTLGCSCIHKINIPFNKTVQFVFSSIGERSTPHPIHLHGHTFHVVHIGYPEYHACSGFIGEHNSDIVCNENCSDRNPMCDEEKCTRPRWSKNQTFSINETTVRKDTVIVPAGGYVVINFLSNNPGYWFIHCHIEIHQLQGMALIIHEADTVDSKLLIPPEMNKCGDFTIKAKEYLTLYAPLTQD